MKNFFKSNEKKMFYGLGIFLAFFRISMFLRTPLYALANAKHDDLQMVRLAEYLLKGEWLGPYTDTTLIKGLASPMFLAVLNRIGIPYLLGIGSLYTVACILFLYAIREFIQNKWILMCAFGFLLFSPAMLSTFTEQRVYNMALIPAAVLLVSAGLIGMFHTCCEENKGFYGWSILTIVSFVFFWHIRNESIWYLPFTFAACLVCIFCLFRKFHFSKTFIIRAICCVLPFICLWASNEMIASKNEKEYGVHIVNDRSGSAEAEVMSLLLSIDQEKSIKAMGADYTYVPDCEINNKHIWVSREMLELAMAVSPTMYQYRDDLRKAYEVYWDTSLEGNCVLGDSFIWAIRDTMLSNGFYNENAVETNEVYRKIADELQAAFDSGKLVKSHKLYLSALSRGITLEDMPDIMKDVRKGLECLADSRYIFVGKRKSVGTRQEIRLFEGITGNTAIYRKTKGQMDPGRVYSDLTVTRSNKILALYRATGNLRAVLSIILIVLLTVIMIKKLRKKEYEVLGEWIIVLGWIGSLLLFVTAVITFSQFIGPISIYINYLTAGVTLIDMIEVVVLGSFADKAIRKLCCNFHTNRK